MQTNFFDDYILISEESLKKSTSQAFENLLDLLGWAVDRDGPKATNFSRSANALGITFDLSCSESYILRIRNTESRKKEIVEEIGVILREKRLSKPKALQLRGRLGFAENQIFGRASKQAMNTLIEHAFHDREIHRVLLIFLDAR